MLGNVMAVHLSQDCKRLEPRVDCFVSPLHPLLESISLRRTAYHCLGNLASEWALSFVAIICLNSFKIIQKSGQGLPENCDIIELATRIWTIDPLQLSRHNPNSQLITDTRLLFKFVGGKGSTLL